MRFKVGQRVRIIKYRKVDNLYGIIKKMDPILSANMKRAIGYWFVIEYCQTIEYYSVKGEKSLYLKQDIEATDG